MSGVPKETYEFTRHIPFSEHLGIKVDGAGERAWRASPCS